MTSPPDSAETGAAAPAAPGSTVAPPDAPPGERRAGIRVADPADGAPRGSRVRAGNGMGRTRRAVAAGTAQCLQHRGARKTTMIDIASAAGIAKGTLYNHVRTRSEAYVLLAETEVDHLVVMLRESGDPHAALSAAAQAVAAHPVLRQLAASEPWAVTVLALPGPVADPLRTRVRQELRGVLGEVRGPLAFRWLLSLLLDPGSDAERAAAVDLLVGSD